MSNEISDYEFIKQELGIKKQPASRQIGFWRDRLWPGVKWLLLALLQAVTMVVVATLGVLLLALIGDALLGRDHRHCN